MQKNLVETVLGAVVLLVTGGFLAFFYKTTDIHPASGYVITAAFTTVEGLDAGSPVKVGGVKVGQVLGFSIDQKNNYQAVVTMNIDNDVKLPKDTAAVIASAGLLDGKFMSLQPGGDDQMLQNNDKITITQSTPGLEQLLGQVIFSMTNNKDSKDGKGGSKKPAGGAQPASIEHP